jgi:hypothetical protein
VLPPSPPLLLPPLVPDGRVPELPPFEGVDVPDVLLPLLAEALGILLLLPSEDVDPDPPLPEEVEVCDAYTIVIAVGL